MAPGKASIWKSSLSELLRGPRVPRCCPNTVCATDGTVEADADWPAPTALSPPMTTLQGSSSRTLSLHTGPGWSRRGAGGGGGVGIAGRAGAQAGGRRSARGPRPGTAPGSGQGLTGDRVGRRAPASRALRARALECTSGSAGCVFEAGPAPAPPSARQRRAEDTAREARAAGTRGGRGPELPGAERSGGTQRAADSGEDAVSGKLSSSLRMSVAAPFTLDARREIAHHDAAGAARGARARRGF
ncbi:uncharacterized protein [Dipodomys merriami]|uniref:uncharacterized protein n=1 Tax=Dipodomys merriami TaxID=94247 RepID=UPI003855BDFD